MRRRAWRSTQVVDKGSQSEDGRVRSVIANLGPLEEGAMMPTADSAPTKPMRLRYPGTCRQCTQPVPAGEWAIYDRVAKNVVCLTCIDADNEHEFRPNAPDDVAEAEAELDVVAPPPEAGTAGASARREHDRRAAKREAGIRAAHPRVGGFILALTDEPQHVQAWARGARGEELLAKRLDGLADRSVVLLHDRRIPPGHANIDHIAISPAGIFVIDAKRYQGRPHLRIEGGFLRPRTETLFVGRRDCTKLVAGVVKQVDRVRAAISATGIADVPILGMLCFIEADWPLIGGSFTTGGIDVLWPAKAAEKITADGPLTDNQAVALHRHLAGAFPAA
jgi:hypothetical protein